MSPDELFMQRAMELAELGFGFVSPNPKVGCVIAFDGKIIGEGWHQKYGENHAEVNAILSVSDNSLLSASTAYVNLEPCSHIGKTPPCADLLIKHKLKRVVIGCQDPNPMVAGRGIDKLKAAGIEVVSGVLESKAREINKRFFTFIEQKRPYLILKWAQTADGYMAKDNYESKWISNERSRQLVHKWRSQEDGVLIGARTAAIDNPKLSVRDWSGRNPIRIILDWNSSLDDSLNVFDGTQSTFCYNLKTKSKNDKNEFIRLKEHKLTFLLDDLFSRRIQSIMIEGGAGTLTEFIKEDFWDEMRVFTSPITFGSGVKAPIISGKIISSEQIGEDKLTISVKQQTG